METNDKIKIAAALVVIVLVIIIVWRILGKVGLVKSKEQKLKDSAVTDLQSASYFDPNYYKGKTFTPLGKSGADAYAKMIYNTKGVFKDNENETISIFSRLTNRCNISEIADSFNTLYRKDLKAYIMGFFNKTQMEQLMKVINKLPVR